MFKKPKTATMPTGGTRTYNGKIKIYRDANEEYRWRLVGSNGRIIADSAEGYVTKYNCEQAVARFRAAASEAIIVESAQDLSE
jgi:uncharacterized protein YegP (UPF0339 family)